MPVSSIWAHALAPSRQAPTSRQRCCRPQRWCALQEKQAGRGPVRRRAHLGGRGAQKNIFGNLAWPHATVQLDFKREDGAPVKTATVKAKGSETETLPLFTNKDDVRGEVRAALQQVPAVLALGALHPVRAAAAEPGAAGAGQGGQRAGQEGGAPGH